jgi:hypothetical protein
MYGHPNNELVGRIKGFTHNFENGVLKKYKLTPEMIFKEKATNETATTKFTLPNVKVGSIIEYSYEIETPFGVSNNPSTWTFQGQLPVLWSEYKIGIPNYFYYRMLMSGYLDLYLTENKPINITLDDTQLSGIEYHFILKDAPAIREEPFITTIGDYISKIDFELASVEIPGSISKNFSLDYVALSKTLLDDENFGLAYKRSNFMKDSAKEIMTKTKDTAEVLAAAMASVRKQMKWNEDYGIYTNGLKKALEKKEGSSADMNLTLICLLKELGFEANPLILSTRSHGTLHSQYAIRNRFNFVLAHLMLNGKDVLLDATEEFLKIGMIPTDCLNHKGYLIHPTDPRMISLEPIEKDVEFEKATMRISEDGEMSGTFHKSYGGYSAWSARKEFKKEGKEKFLEEIKKGKPNWSISKADYKNETDITNAFEVNYDLTMSEQASVAGNMMYINPMLTEGHGTSPFQAKERNFPVDLSFPIEESFMVEFEIPKGYQLVEKPKSSMVSLPDNGGKFTYAVSIVDNKITVSSRISFKKSVYAAEDYPALKEFYDKIVAKHAEKIILKK